MKGKCTLMALVLVVFNVAIAKADDAKYELGAGMAGLTAPHYPGADQSFDLLVPMPYVTYRSERIQANREGVRALVFDNDRLDFSFSLAAGLPVDGEDNKARTGMPDLDLLLEAGPALRYKLFQNEQGARLRLDIPVRAAFSVDSLSMNHQGWVTTPGLVFNQPYRHWSLGFSLAAMAGDREYQGYFYDVGAPYATVERHNFDADSGYMGTFFSLSASRRFDHLFVGAFARQYALQGAENIDSPLLRDKQNFSAGFMIAWIFATSGTGSPQEDL